VKRSERERESTHARTKWKHKNAGKKDLAYRAAHRPFLFIQCLSASFLADNAAVCHKEYVRLERILKTLRQRWEEFAEIFLWTTTQWDSERGRDRERNKRPD